VIITHAGVKRMVDDLRIHNYHIFLRPNVIEKHEFLHRKTKRIRIYKTISTNVSFITSHLPSFGRRRFLHISNVNNETLYKDNLVKTTRTHYQFAMAKESNSQGSGPIQDVYENKQSYWKPNNYISFISLYSTPADERLYSTSIADYHFL
jgi:hypothetical protein